MAAKHIGLIANLDKAGAVELLDRLCRDLAGAGHEVHCTSTAATALQSFRTETAGNDEPESSAPKGLELEDLADASEVLIVLGGDGTLLNIAAQLRERAKPLAGVNIGTLGFLTCVTSDETDRLVEALGDARFEISRRRILEAQVQIDGEPSQEYTALNEIVISRGTTSRTVQVETRVDGAFVNHYSGDGLIVATPTGSTAYSMSAGGPIVHPLAPVLVITPVCPHTLANRAIVVDDSREIELLIPDQRDPLYLTVDGQAMRELHGETRVRIARAKFDLPLMTLPDASFFHVLRGKLGWYGSSVRKGD